VRFEVLVKNLIQKGLDKGRALLGQKQESIISAAFLMMVLVGLTKIAGFVKLHLFARMFGASRELDVFWAAFTIPDLIFYIVVAGSVNAALIPFFAKKLAGGGGKGGGEDGVNHSSSQISDLFSQIVNLFSVIFMVAGVLIFIFAPQLCKIIASGGAGGLAFEAGRFIAEDLALMVRLMRIMVISPVILGMSSVFTAGIQVNKRFLVPSLAPLFYNLGIIFGALFFSGVLSMGVTGLAWGVVVGSVLHLLVQIPLAHKLGLTCRPKFSLWSKEIVDIIKLALPRIFGLIGEQINVLVNTVISLGLVEGSLSAYRFGSSIHLLPIQLLGTTISQAALPTMSLEYHDCKDSGECRSFAHVFTKSLHQILFFIFPAVVFIAVLRLPIVRLVLGAGAFDWEDTVITSWVLALFSFAIIGQAVLSLVARAFYAMQETVLPMLVSFAGVAINITGAILFTNFFSHYYDWRPILSVILERPGGFYDEFWGDMLRWFTTRSSSMAAVGGLALSTGVALVIEVLVLLFFLNKKVKIFSWKGLYQPILRKMFASGVMFFVMYFLYKYWNFSLDTSTVISIAGLFTVVGGVGVLVYFGVSAVIDVTEVNFFVNLVRKGVKSFDRVLHNGKGH